MRTGFGRSFYHWTWQRMRLACDKPVLGIAPAGRKTRFPLRFALRGGIGYPQDSNERFLSWAGGLAARFTLAAPAPIP